MAINVRVEYDGGLLPDIILLTQCYYHRGTRLNVGSASVGDLFPDFSAIHKQTKKANWSELFFLCKKNFFGDIRRIK